MSFEPFARFSGQVTSEGELRAIVGLPGELAVKKETNSLDEHMRRFIAHSPLVLISTHSRDGRCDASPRGDPPGFVHVIDDHTLLIPDRRGNRRIDSMRNILETGRIGLLFLVPGMGETLRINGRATVIRDQAWLAPLAAQGQQPQLGIAVAAEECFLQCAKALLRSKLWQPQPRPDLNSLPGAAQMFVDHAQMPEYDTEKMQTLLDGAYERLY